MSCTRMANQEFTVAQSIRRAPSLRTPHECSTCVLANQEFTVALNIGRAPSSLAKNTLRFQQSEPNSSAIILIMKISLLSACTLSLPDSPNKLMASLINHSLILDFYWKYPIQCYLNQSQAKWWYFEMAAGIKIMKTCAFFPGMWILLIIIGLEWQNSFP